MFLASHTWSSGFSSSTLPHSAAAASNFLRRKSESALNSGSSVVFGSIEILSKVLCKAWVYQVCAKQFSALQRKVSARKVGSACVKEKCCHTALCHVPMATPWQLHGSRCNTVCITDVSIGSKNRFHFSTNFCFIWNHIYCSQFWKNHACAQLSLWTSWQILYVLIPYGFS